MVQDPTEAEPLTAAIKDISQVSAEAWAFTCCPGKGARDCGKQVWAFLNQATSHPGIPWHYHLERRGQWTFLP
jgi:hypothetical protein